MAYWVYILQSQSTGQFYVGSAQHVERRLRRHNAGGARYTRSRGPWVLMHSEEHPTRGEAVAREQQIKRMKSRAYIESLIEKP